MHESEDFSAAVELNPTDPALSADLSNQPPEPISQTPTQSSAWIEREEQGASPLVYSADEGEQLFIHLRSALAHRESDQEGDPAATGPFAALDAFPDRAEDEDARVEDGLRYRCRRCKNADSTAVFLPCGHRVTCLQCGWTCVYCPTCGGGIWTPVEAQLI